MLSYISKTINCWYVYRLSSGKFFMHIKDETNLKQLLQVEEHIIMICPYCEYLNGCNNKMGYLEGIYMIRSI